MLHGSAPVPDCISPRAEPMHHLRRLATRCAIVLALPACSGGVAEDTTDESTSSPRDRDNDPNPEEADGGMVSGDPKPPTGVEPTPPPAATITPAAPGEVTRAARLTHTQYANTIRDLLGVEDALSDGFAPDALNGFEFSTSLDYAVDGRLAPQYQQAAETLAERVVTDDAVWSHVMPCAEATDECRDRFVTEFGLRAFRRPVTEQEHSAIAALFAQGPELVASGDDVRDGVQVVVEALLQSPYFLYRVELSNDPDSETVALSDYEIASRLSFLLLDSMPDDELFAAAADGKLSDPTEVRSQVERLLESPRATQQLVSFHEQAWQFGRYNKVSPDSTLFPDLPDDFATRLLNASQRFVADVVEAEGGVAELLTAPFAYADESWAHLYDEEVTGDLQRIDLDPAQRLGILGQVGFLASHAHAQKTDPIHRGLFVTRDLLCRSVGVPPAGASMATLPEGSPRPETTREEVTLLTSPKGCVECHALINPPGFAFEGFDAVGQSRDSENGTPVDTKTTVLLDGSDHNVSGAVELISLLATSAEVRDCYATKWLTFAHGRKLTTDELGDLSHLNSPISVRELVSQIASDSHYLTRPSTEVSQ